MVDFLYKHGFVFSYDRIRNLMNSIVFQNLQHFSSINALASPHLKLNSMVIDAVDNVDKQARNTSGGAMHATSISLFQQHDNTVTCMLLHH